MEVFPNGYTLAVPDGCFPLGTDTMALGHFANIPKRGRCLDLGSGCGALGVLLCSTRPDISVTGLELNPTAHDAAMENIRRNALTARMESICGDIREVPKLFPTGRFDVCVSNPPYYPGGPASRQTPYARRNDFCALSDLMRAAAWATKFGGDFFLVHKPEFLEDILVEARAAGFAAKRLCLLRHKPGLPVSLILVGLRKGGKPGMKWEEQTLYSENGQPSDFYKNIYHMEE